MFDNLHSKSMESTELMANTKGKLYISKDPKLTVDDLEYDAMTVKPKEIVIITFIVLLWLFSVHRSRYSIK